MQRERERENVCVRKKRKLVRSRVRFSNETSRIRVSLGGPVGECSCWTLIIYLYPTAFSAEQQRYCFRVIAAGLVSFRVSFKNAESSPQGR